MVKGLKVLTIFAFSGAMLFAQIPTGPGWHQLPNTKMGNICEDGVNTCGGVFAWSGGVFDTKRNRLIIWGGGHGDYSGNEVYALNLSGTPNFVRLNRSTAGGCSMESCDGGVTPNSRHTYDGIVYMPNCDRMWVHGGSMAGMGWCNSNCEPNTWLLDFTSLTWRGSTPSGLNPGQGSYNIMMSDYDPNTGKVFTKAMSSNDGYLYAYTFSTDTYQRLGANSATDGYWGCGVIDPKRKKFLCLGGGESSIHDISGSGSYNRQAFTSTGGDFIKSSGYPGLAYDPVRDRIVAWNGGDSVFSLNMDTRVWTKATYSGGPGARNGTGTYKRWSYVPALDVFVLVNSITQNAFIFRFPSTGVEDAVPAALPAVRGNIPSRCVICNVRGQVVREVPGLVDPAHLAFQTLERGLPNGLYFFRISNPCDNYIIKRLKLDH